MSQTLETRPVESNKLTRRSFLAGGAFAGATFILTPREVLAQAAGDYLKTPSFFQEYLQQTLGEANIGNEVIVANGNYRIFSQARRLTAFSGTEISDALARLSIVQQTLPLEVMEEVNNPLLVQGVVEDPYLVWDSPFHGGIIAVALRSSNWDLIEYDIEKGARRFDKKHPDIFNPTKLKYAGYSPVSRNQSEIFCRDGNGNLTPIMSSSLKRIS